MPGNKPWLEGPTERDHAIAKMWQGGPFFLMSVIFTAGTHFLLGFVWIWAILLGLAGLFRFVTGLVTYLTGVE